jgi:hypothetical protein
VSERWVYTYKGWARADGPQHIDPTVAPAGPVWDHYRKAANASAYAKPPGTPEKGGPST